MAVTFGALLREYRRSAGMTQRQLAVRVGVDFTYVSKLENGRLPAPSASTTSALCRAMGVPPDRLMALAGKLPSDVEQEIAVSPSAQEFFREALRIRPDDEQWARLTERLRTME